MWTGTFQGLIFGVNFWGQSYFLRIPPEKIVQDWGQTYALGEILSGKMRNE